MARSIEDIIIQKVKVGLFSEIPKVGDKNPMFELCGGTYERKEIECYLGCYYTNKKDITFEIDYYAALSVKAAALLDRENVVVKVYHVNSNTFKYLDHYNFF